MIVLASFETWTSNKRGLLECATWKYGVDALKNIFCLVCGYKLDFIPWQDGVPSDELCPCCGIQFGYDDAAGGNLDKRNLIYKEWRNIWISEGMPWKSRGIDKPVDWDPKKQLEVTKPKS